METSNGTEVVAARKVGRNANGFDRDAGSVLHAITAAAAVSAERNGGSWAPAACATKPGSRGGNGWRVEAGRAVTCPACLKALRYGRTPNPWRNGYEDRKARAVIRRAEFAAIVEARKGNANGTP